VNALDVTFMTANAAGVAIYLVLASHAWRIPQEHGMVPVTGEPFVWALALPVLGVFLIADTIWGVLLLRARESTRGLGWFVTAAAWLLGIGIDFSRHWFRTLSLWGKPAAQLQAVNQEEAACTAVMAKWVALKAKTSGAPAAEK